MASEWGKSTLFCLLEWKIQLWSGCLWKIFQGFWTVCLGYLKVLSINNQGQFGNNLCRKRINRENLAWAHTGHRNGKAVQPQKGTENVWCICCLSSFAVSNTTGCASRHKQALGCPWISVEPGLSLGWEAVEEWQVKDSSAVALSGWGLAALYCSEGLTWWGQGPQRISEQTGLPFWELHFSVELCVLAVLLWMRWWWNEEERRQHGQRKRKLGRKGDCGWEGKRRMRQEGSGAGLHCLLTGCLWHEEGLETIFRLSPCNWVPSWLLLACW